MCWNSNFCLLKCHVFRVIKCHVYCVDNCMRFLLFNLNNFVECNTLCLIDHQPWLIDFHVHTWKIHSTSCLYATNAFVVLACWYNNCNMLFLVTFLLADDARRPQQSGNNTAKLSLIVALDSGSPLSRHSFCYRSTSPMCFSFLFLGSNDLSCCTNNWLNCTKYILNSRMVGSHSKYNYVLQENDPPPWLHRMRELGYPPGYLGKPNFSIHFNICDEVCKLLFLVFIVCVAVWTTLVKKEKS
jgi:hypothetical protein